METIYVTHKNAVIHRCAEHLIIRKKGQKVGTIPLTGLKTIVLMTGVQLTSAAINVVLEKNIDVILTSQGGKIKGRINSISGGGAIVRLAQHSAFINTEKRLSIAKSIVNAKIKNQLALILKSLKHYPLERYFRESQAMEQNRVKLDGFMNLDEIMGIEGICARIYWDAYRNMLKEPLFTRREYRPASDIVNSALNLGYSFLANEISTCLAAKNLDLEIGFLHSIHYGRQSLTLDVMEVFRSPFIDAWLLTLFNKRMLTPDHFLGKENGFYLNELGFMKFCECYHRHLEKGNWQAKFQEEAASLKAALTENNEFKPFLCEEYHHDE